MGIPGHRYTQLILLLTTKLVRAKYLKDITLQSIYDLNALSTFLQTCLLL